MKLTVRLNIGGYNSIKLLDVVFWVLRWPIGSLCWSLTSAARVQFPAGD